VAGRRVKCVLPEEVGDPDGVLARLEEPGAERLEDDLLGRVELAARQLPKPVLGQVVGAKAPDRNAIHLALQLPREYTWREQPPLG
jgi:hypothetical protein